MVDITHKITSLRQAIATATVSVSARETIDAVKDRRVPKGDVFEFSRAAGLLAIKKTSDVIPDCHPLPIEFASITYEIADLAITIRVEVHTIYKTGVEVEAMHGASIAALTMYDMLKPIDSNVEISKIKLEKKSGGRSTYAQHMPSQLRCAVIVCSDSVSAGKKQDTAGKAVVLQLRQYQLDTASYVVIPDDADIIQGHARRLSKEGYDLLVFTGGTGLSPRDVTPDAIAPLLDRQIPGVMEAARSYGQERTPYAMLSRGVAGFMGNTLVLTLPGSTKGAVETMEALFPYITHVFRVAGGMRHDHG